MMDSIITKPKRHRRTITEIRQLLSEQEQSNCTVKKFCTSRSINEGAFFNWRKKYNDCGEATGDFISLQINNADAISSLFAGIGHPSKTVIRLFRPVDASYLKALL